MRKKRTDLNKWWTYIGHFNSANALDPVHPRTCSMSLHQFQITLLFLRIVTSVQYNAHNNTQFHVLTHIFTRSNVSCPHMTQRWRHDFHLFPLFGWIRRANRQLSVHTKQGGMMRNKQVILRTGEKANNLRLWLLCSFTARAKPSTVKITTTEISHTH
jgi:hypothetical protein